MNLRKLTSEEVDQLIASQTVGYFGEYGAVIGDSCNEVITEGRTGYYLVPITEFSQDGPIGIKISKRALLAIGGLPKTQAEILSEELQVSIVCAADILYLRTRSRWTEALEKELIQLHAQGICPNMGEFGSTRETQAQLYWQASSEAKQ